MSSEMRVVRPFRGLDGFQKFLDGVELHVDGNVMEAGSGLTISRGAVTTSAVEIQLAPSDEALEKGVDELRSALEASGLPAESVELVAVSSTPRLRLVHVDRLLMLDRLEELPLAIKIAGTADRPQPLLAPWGGYRIDVLAVLTNDLDEMPLRPWRKGTWLGRARFQVSSQSGDHGFPTLPLTKEKRVEFHLSDDVLRYVHVAEDLLDQDQGGEAVELYVDETLLAHLSMSPNSDAARSFQAQLFLDTMTAVLYSASRMLSQEPRTFDDIKDTLVGRVLEGIAPPKDKGASAEQYATVLDQQVDQLRDRPALVVASVEAGIGKFREYLKSTLVGVTA